MSEGEGDERARSEPLRLKAWESVAGLTAGKNAPRLPGNRLGGARPPQLEPQSRQTKRSRRALGAFLFQRVTPCLKSAKESVNTRFKIPTSQSALCESINQLLLWAQKVYADALTELQKGWGVTVSEVTINICLLYQMYTFERRRKEIVEE